jgi:hypothetical protein
MEVVSGPMAQRPIHFGIVIGDASGTCPYQIIWLLGAPSYQIMDQSAIDGPHYR